MKTPKFSQEFYLFFISKQYEELMDTYFNLPLKVLSLTESAQVSILQSNLQHLKQVIEIRKPETWGLIRRLLQQIGLLKKPVQNVSKLIISKQIYDISKILSPSENMELVRILDSEFLNQEKENVGIKYSVLNSYVRVLRRLPVQHRDEFAKMFFLHDIKDWRVRLQFSQQLDILSDLFSLEKTRTETMLLIFGLC